MALTLIFAILGALVGFINGDSVGAIAGGLLGAMAIQILNIREELHHVRQQLVHMQKSLAKQAATEIQTTETELQVAEIALPQEKPLQQTPLASVEPDTAALATKPESISPMAEVSPSNTVIEQTPQAFAYTPISQQRVYQPEEIVEVRKSAQHHEFEPTANENVSSNTWFVRLQHFLINGNPLVKIGMLVLFIGLSFLAKYVSSSGLFPLEARLAGLGVVGFMLIGFGWKTRERQQYGLVLQGGGLAVLYLTLFVAAKLYPVLSLSSAFAMMFLVVIAATVLAIKQNAQVLSLIATAGGFLVPILTSDGGNNFVGLFSFYLLLNLGVLLLAWFKSWRLLNVTGFCFTFVISLSWCLLSYTSADYLSVQPFLALYFVMYLTLMVLFSMRQPPALKGLVDGSLMFGLPLAAFSQQILIMQDIQHGDAYSALTFAIIYAGLARFIASRFAATHGLFIYTLQVIAAGFATLLIPILLDAQWTSVSFAIEAAGLIWIGFKQNRAFTRYSAYALYAIGCISLFTQPIAAGPTLLISGDFLNLTLLAASAIFMARKLDQYAKNTERSLAPWLFYAGCLWWLTAGGLELQGHFSADFTPLMLIFVSASIASANLLAGKLFWSRPVTLPFALLPIAAFLWFGQILEQIEFGRWQNPVDFLGSLSIIAVFTLQYFWLKQRQIFSALQHVLTAHLGTMILLWFAAYLQQSWRLNDQQLSLLWLVSFALPICTIWLLQHQKRWPITAMPELYLGSIQLPWQLGLAGVFAYCAILPNQMNALGLPLLNIPDAVMVASGGLICRFVWQNPSSRTYRTAFTVSATFILLNTVLLRCLHHHLAIPYQLDELLDDARVQTVLSIFWTIAATATMLLASKKLRRSWWLAGLSLMAVVVAKLFLVDLADNGSLTRIISFLSVGGIMLLIGYFSPIPPKASEPPETTSTN